MDSVIGTAKVVNNAVKTWTNAETGLKEVLDIVKEVVEETGMQDLLGNVGKSQKGLLNFGKNIIGIASKVVDKVASYVPLADEYTTMAEDIIKFIDNFDVIEDVIKNVADSVKLSKTTAVAKRKPGGCYRKNALLPDLCVSLTTITPEVSLYKKLWFPLEMMFLNMLSTKGMIPDISAVRDSMCKRKLDQEMIFYNIHPSLPELALLYGGPQFNFRKCKNRPMFVTLRKRCPIRLAAKHVSSSPVSLTTIFLAER